MSTPVVRKTIETLPQVPAKIVLGITGGIAAYKSAELLRLLVKAGHDVQVAMTGAAEQFITRSTMQALSGQPVWTSLWEEKAVAGARANGMTHIELTRQASLVLIAPASADFLAKLANGLADDLLSTACLARDPARTMLAVAPAMNREMWDNPATQRNVSQLRRDGIQIWGPEGGDQACGEIGMGRMREPEALFDNIQQTFAPKIMKGLNVLVTAGPTFESIDPVRGLTNRSSGKMGYAIAEAAKAAGAIVTLVTGPTSIQIPAVDQVISISTASELFDEVVRNISDNDVFFSVAAVADYTPEKVSGQKMKKADQTLLLRLKPTKDVLAYVASLKNPPYCVGFAAESQNIVELASKKRERKRIPLIVANHANSAIGADDNEVTLIWEGGSRTLSKAPKTEIAAKLIAETVMRLNDRPSVNATSIGRKSKPQKGKS